MTEARVANEGAKTLSRRWFVLPLAVYAASRLVTVAAVYLARFISADRSLLFLLANNWDAGWYLMIAEGGYPDRVPEGIGEPAQSRLGFFPGYPLTTRVMDVVLPGGLATAGFIVNIVAGAVAAVVVWRLMRLLYDEEVATRVLYLFCFFPGSYALTYAYSEGLFVLCAAATLLLLHQRRWLTAAVPASFAGVLRPVGWSLALCCAFAVVMEWRRSREWRPLLSPVIAAGGFLAYSAFLWARTGDALAWRTAQVRGWEQGMDLGQTTVRRIIDTAKSPGADLNMLVPVIAVLMTVALGVLFVRARPPGTHLIFVAASLIPGLLSTGTALTPRHVFAAFPILIGPARLLGTHANVLLVAVFACLLTASMILISGTPKLIP